MERFWALLVDQESVPGRLVTTGLILVLAFGVAAVISWLLLRREDDPYGRYYKRKGVRYGVALLALLAVALTWRAFAGRAAVVIGLAAAGIAFAMQEVIGAVAGWVNILSGRIFRIGDRIQMGGVRGDVVDITPLRTKILEMGAAPDEAADDGEASTWVKGRQYTGRLVSVSNKKSFTDPVFNFSSGFDFIWEELTLPVPHRDDWRRAERILLEEVQRVKSDEAEAALREMTRRYPVPRAELEPRVFLRATDNWMELSARFIVPTRTARTVKDDITRRVLDRFTEAGITIASETVDAAVRVERDEA